MSQSLAVSSRGYRRPSGAGSSGRAFQIQSAISLAFGVDPPRPCLPTTRGEHAAVAAKSKADDRKGARRKVMISRPSFASHTLTARSAPSRDQTDSRRVRTARALTSGGVPLQGGPLLPARDIPHEHFMLVLAAAGCVRHRAVRPHSPRFAFRRDSRQPRSPLNRPLNRRTGFHVATSQTTTSRAPVRRVNYARLEYRRWPGGCRRN